MESIKFYKLISPYSEDITKNCNLTITDIDDNFLAFKDNDISASTFDSENYIINVIRNNGEEIAIDVSDIKDYIDAQTSGSTEDKPSPLTTGDIELTLTPDGNLTMSWKDLSGRTSTNVSGFITTENTIVADYTTIQGDGTDDNPFRTSNTEKTSDYKNALDIVDSLPTDGLKSGDRYITKETTILDWGVLYSKAGVDKIIAMLKLYGLSWRVPTKEDWDILLQHSEVCEGGYESEEIDIIQGSIAGKVLKSTSFWVGNENLDTYGISILPCGYADEYKQLVTDPQISTYWTSTEYSGNTNYTKEFDADLDAVKQMASNEDEMYSLRLVMDYNDSITGFDANIFGKKYDIVYLSSINQIWIKENLNEVLSGEDYSKKYTYSGQTEVTKYYINHWNGTYWEKKELENGDTINVNKDGIIYEYKTYVDNNGNTTILNDMKITPTRVIFDAGIY